MCQNRRETRSTRAANVPTSRLGCPIVEPLVESPGIGFGYTERAEVVTKCSWPVVIRVRRPFPPAQFMS